MLAPYANRPSIKGEARFTPEQLTKVVGMLDGRGWQVMTHAIGDAAVRMTLDAYEAAAKANRGAGARPPSSHRAHRDDRSAGHSAIRPARRGGLDAARSCHAEPDARRCVEHEHRRGARVARMAVGEHRQGQGPARLRQRLAGHDLRSESRPARRRHADHRPMACRRAAWHARRERLPLRQAIQAYTRDGAWASFDEQRKGTLARDMLADIVVLSEDIFSGTASPPARDRGSRDDCGRQGRLSARPAGNYHRPITV